MQEEGGAREGKEEGEEKGGVGEREGKESKEEEVKGGEGEGQ